MRQAWVGVVLIAGACAAVGCGGGASRREATSTDVSTTTTSTSSTSSILRATTTTAPAEPVSLETVPPHFDTPEAAMRYLATAWNENDLVSLRHVTDPDGRRHLDEMRAEAVDLRLDRCEANPEGDYTCFFDHDYPDGHVPTGAHGEAAVLVGPADTPGWYMTTFKYCG